MKKYLCFALAAIMTLGLYGCNTDAGGGAAPGTEAPAQTPDAKSEEPGEESTAPQGGGELNILTWEGYVPQDVVDSFEAETGIKVNYSSADTNEAMFSRLQAANGGEYDILIISDYIIVPMLEEGGLLKALDKDRLTNFQNIDPAYMGQYFDPDNAYTIPYAPSSALLVYDSDALDFEVTSYADLWREELKDSVVLLDGDRDIIGLTLQMMGHSLNETDPDILEEAKDKMLELKENVIGFDANTPHNMIISGDATVGYMFGSQATEAISAKPSVKFAFPEEGMGLYLDNLVMAANAPNEDNAYIFLDYILDGENSAAISNSIFYSNCNLAARDFLSEEYLSNEMINIPESALGNLEAYADVGEARTIYSRIWTEFKSY